MWKEAIEQFELPEGFGELAHPEWKNLADSFSCVYRSMALRRT